MKSIRYLTTSIAALTCILASTSIPASAQTLLAHYTFDEGTGTTAADSSGYGTATNGTLVGGAGWTTNTPSGSGSALALDGRTTPRNYAEAANTKVNTITDSFTISLWVNLQAAPVNGDRFVSTLMAGSGFDFSIQDPRGATGQNSGTISASNFSLAVFVNSTGNAAISLKTNYSAANQWVFIAATYSKGSVKFYTGTADDNVSGLTTVLAGALPASVAASSNPLQIGDTPVAGSSRTLNGYLDDVRIYSGVASQSFLEGVRLENLSTVPEPSTTIAIVATLSLLAALIVRQRRA